MKKKYFLPFLILISPLAQGFSALPQMPSLEEPQNLIVNNRILAKLNDKTISVIDVVKRMDVFLNRAYPHLAGSKLARYQFYSANWRDILEQMIDDELILMDSEGKDLKISDGDVREKLQERFGPNVMGNLDKLGLSYEEAKKMIHTELVVQKMVWFRVNSKALLSVNPRNVKEFFKEYCIEHPSVETWKYQVLSIRSKNQTEAEKIASRAYERLMHQQSDFSNIASQLVPPLPSDAETIMPVSNIEQSPASITVSEDYEVTDKEISEAHRKVLSNLKTGDYSQPVSQLSRFDNTTVFRIFLLKNHSKTSLPSFESIEEKLENELIQKAIAKENQLYIKKLRERLGFDAKHMKESIPEDFQPFLIN